MSILSSLEKYGLGEHAEMEIIEAAEPEKQEEIPEKKAVIKEEPKETDYLITKRLTCPVCGNKVNALAIRATKLRRMESDRDLRPRHEHIDTLKYDTALCTFCGYAALIHDFESLSSFQIKRLKEQVQAKFVFKMEPEKEIFSYEEAIDRYQLCLLSAIVKKVKTSEKAYICLKIAWLYRELLDGDTYSSREERIKQFELKRQYDGFYRQAYDGFLKAIVKEAPPFCGMKMNTIEYLLSCMAVYFGDIPVANRYLSNILFSRTISSKMRSRCVELKEELSELKEEQSLI